MDDQLPEIDVVIPLFNGIEFLKQTVESLQAQSYKPSRIIIVDDHSTDKSFEFANSLPGVEVYKNPKTTGQCASARNYGVSLSNAQLIAFSDQDDLYHPSHFELLKGVLLRHKDADAAAALYVPFKAEGKVSYEIVPAEALIEDMWKPFPFSNYAEPSLLLFRREVFNRTLWYEKYPGLADHFIWNELSVNKKIYRLPVKTVGRRLHDQSHFHQLTADPLALTEEWVMTNEDLLRKCLPLFESEGQKKVILKRQQICVAFKNSAESLISESDAGLKRNLKELKHLLKDEEDEFKKNFFDEFWLLLQRIGNSHKGLSGQRAVKLCYKQMSKSWPDGANELKGRIFAMRPGGKFYLRPFDITLMVLFCKALINKLRILFKARQEKPDSTNIEI